MEARFIPNDFPSLFALDDPEQLLKQALQDIITDLPPREDYFGVKVSGFWSGPTGLAYLFLQASVRQPDLKIDGNDCLSWAKRYLEGTRGELELTADRCGIGSEKLAYEAVRACVSKDLDQVKVFTSSIPEIVAGKEYPNEILHGRAGTLYLLRLLRHWVPGSAELVEESIQAVSEAILSDGPEWTWHGKPYLGAVHGDISIVTQLVLTTPSLAGRVEEKLVGLLDLQVPSGNWPILAGRLDHLLVQFCHGAPGFVHSLLALRPHFPGLRAKIDMAIEKGQQCVWEEGLLVKQPSICHGIFGNALALPRGPKRDHFLAVATPTKMSELKQKEKRLFEPADYGTKYAILTGYLPGASWAWLVSSDESPGLIYYTDV
ncbi:hypothetical protein M406DRAFT_324359 [Cryphonectria parasitica EP155]|uniref:Uncharacterized protein n=1 Tax=Cryphonectria parasitica (strain ATCC 38755 / EP155) TaxID=660469 RepID=A0A9P5CIH1_CRYP1|nr:uncharacterized protein M406DRAFT_324359 [Cryphonectria parasitica EP155]KAF3760533.1 hypothetical protein M406DRAFT_324359 [Cryphonectria parasitica EP155]